MSRVPRWQKLALSGAGALVIASAMAGYFEGTRLKAYQDVGGIWTICQGHAQGVKPGETATLAQCQAMLSRDMADADRHVQACIKRPMTDTQRAALDDLAYNIGWPRFCRSSVVREFNRGNTRAACDRILLYDKADGRVLPGLVKRRSAERALCLQ